MPQKIEMRSAKYWLKYIVPYNFVHMWWAWRYKHNHANWPKLEKQMWDKGLLKRFENCRSTNFNYDQAVSFLSSLADSKTEDHIRSGSISQDSLHFCVPYITTLYRNEPLFGLHVGNFVGISLAYFINVVRDLHPDSRVVSIDPNLQHRGFKNPLNQTISLLNHFGLQDNSLILTGYSLEANPYFETPTQCSSLTSAFDVGLSCAHQLTGLAMITPSKFDFCVMDGNHIGDYLEREIRVIDGLLKVGGLLILDDVHPFWNEVQKIFDSIDETKYQKVGADGRLGILKKLK